MERKIEEAILGMGGEGKQACKRYRKKEMVDFIAFEI